MCHDYQCYETTANLKRLMCVFMLQLWYTTIYTCIYILFKRHVAFKIIVDIGYPYLLTHRNILYELFTFYTHLCGCMGAGDFSCMLTPEMNCIPVIYEMTSSLLSVYSMILFNISCLHLRVHFKKDFQSWCKYKMEKNVIAAINESVCMLQWIPNIKQ